MVKSKKGKPPVKKDDEFVSTSVYATDEPLHTENGAENVHEQNERTENENTESDSSESEIEIEAIDIKDNLPQENVKRENNSNLPKKDKNNQLHQPDGKIGQHKGYSPLYILGLAPIVAISAMYLFSNPNHIEMRLKELANDFPNQSTGSFRKLKSRAMSYINHRTTPQPFVLLVASTKDDQLTAKCYATRVAKLFGTSTITINGSKYSSAVSDDAKREIDVRLRDIFKRDIFPTAAVIHNLDSIPYGTTTLFYAYCDHDNPMYKEAAIIFTVTLPQSYQIGDDEVDREGLVVKYLSEDSQWVNDKTFSIDVMGALISRITDTVIVVNKESRESLEKSC